jgi:hypothetical protein
VSACFALMALALFLVGTRAPTASAQDAAPSCADRVVVRGDDAAAAELRAAISASRLRRWSSGACEGAEITVSRDAGSWTVTVRRPEVVSEHTVVTLAPLVAWIESWLAPPATLPDELAAGATVATPRGAAPAPESRVHEPAVTERAASGRGPSARVHEPIDALAPRTTRADTRTSQFALRLLVDADDRLVVWPGLELAIRFGITPAAWIGASVSGAWTPNENGVERRMLRIAVRGGWKGDVGVGVLAFGAGFGLVAADGSRIAPVQMDDEQGGPFVELMASYDFPIAETWVVSLAVLGHYYFPDATGELPHPVNPLEPEPLTAFSFSLQFGVAWNLRSLT